MGGLSSLRPHWPVVAFLCSGALLAGAHAFETFGNMVPCPLCLQQREVHWLILGLAAAGFVLLRLRASLGRFVAVVLGLGFLLSFAAAARHVGVEQHWLPETCAASADLGDLTFDPNAPLIVPRCDVPAWTMFGVSMAGYNGLISLALAIFSFMVAFASRRGSIDVASAAQTHG